MTHQQKTNSEEKLMTRIKTLLNRGRVSLKYLGDSWPSTMIEFIDKTFIIHSSFSDDTHREQLGCLIRELKKSHHSVDRIICIHPDLEVQSFYFNLGLTKTALVEEKDNYIWERAT